MSNKELDLLIEQYFGTVAAPTLNLEMLVEMIEDSYPDITARSDPAGLDRGPNPEMIATHVPANFDRATVENVVAQMTGSPDPAMVDRVMLHLTNPQGLSDKGSPQAQINEGRLPPDSSLVPA